MHYKDITLMLINQDQLILRTINDCYLLYYCVSLSFICEVALYQKAVAYGKGVSENTKELLENE